MNIKNIITFTLILILLLITFWSLWYFDQNRNYIIIQRQKNELTFENCQDLLSLKEQNRCLKENGY